MDYKFVALDVETPNHSNNRICSIGLSVIGDDETIETKSYLVNPECDYDYSNVHIHGITERTTQNAMTFPQVWETIRTLLFDRIIIAHNAVFDLSVLRKTLSAYGITEPPIKYIDTFKISRLLLPSLPDHKLNTLADFFNIALSHHIAGSDSQATAEIFLKLCPHGNNADQYIREYYLCVGNEETSGFSHRSKRRSAESVALSDLHNILTYITADDIIDAVELSELTYWLNEHTELAGNYPYDTIVRQIESIVEDGVVEKSELEALLQTCNKLKDPVNASCPKGKTEVDICGKNIVLSGEFSIGSKSEVEAMLIEKGAVIQNSVNKKTNFVLVGSLGNSAWVAGNYGTKVKKAMELQEKGIEIGILKEHEFFAIGG